jgi:hypothetical protein
VSQTSATPPSFKSIYCDERVEQARLEIRIDHSARGTAITIVERRLPCSELAGSEASTTRVAVARRDRRGRDEIFWG